MKFKNASIYTIYLQIYTFDGYWYKYTELKYNFYSFRRLLLSVGIWTFFIRSSGTIKYISICLNTKQNCSLIKKECKQTSNITAQYSSHSCVFVWLWWVHVHSVYRKAPRRPVNFSSLTMHHDVDHYTRINILPYNATPKLPKVTK